MTKQSNKRKFLATTLTATMVAAAVAPVAGAAAADTQTFPDVPADHPYAGVIADMVEAGVVKGQPDGNFNIHGNMTRAEAALIVANLLDLPVAPAANSTEFEDVKDNAWYTGAVNALVAEGIVAGKTAVSFAPNANITRAELSQLLVVAYGLEDKNVEDVELTFTDVKEDVWYTDAIKILASEGLIKGVDAAQTKFAPNDNMKRGDFAWLSANVDYAHGDKLPKPEVVDQVIESVKAINGTQVEVTFSEVPKNSPVVEDFKIEGLEVKSVNPKAGSDKTFILTTDAQTAGKTYTLAYGETTKTFIAIQQVSELKAVTTSYAMQVGKEVTVEYKVLDQAGNPIVGKEIYVRAGSTTSNVGFPAIEKTLTSDANGIVQFKYTRNEATSNTIGEAVVAYVVDQPLVRNASTSVIWTVSDTSRLTVEASAQGELGHNTIVEYTIDAKDADNKALAKGETINFDFTYANNTHLNTNGVVIEQKQQNGTWKQVGNDISNNSFDLVEAGKATIRVIYANPTATNAEKAIEVVPNFKYIPAGATTPEEHSIAIAPALKYVAQKAVLTLDPVNADTQVSLTEGKDYVLTAKDQFGNPYRGVVHLGALENVDGLASTDPVNNYTISVDSDGDKVFELPGGLTLPVNFAVGQDDKVDEDGKVIVRINNTHATSNKLTLAAFVNPTAEGYIAANEVSVSAPTIQFGQAGPASIKLASKSTSVAINGGTVGSIDFETTLLDKEGKEVTPSSPMVFKVQKYNTATKKWEDNSSATISIKDNNQEIGTLNNGVYRVAKNDVKSKFGKVTVTPAGAVNNDQYRLVSFADINNNDTLESDEISALAEFIVEDALISKGKLTSDAYFAFEEGSKVQSANVTTPATAEVTYTYELQDQSGEAIKAGASGQAVTWTVTNNTDGEIKLNDNANTVLKKGETKTISTTVANGASTTAIKATASTEAGKEATEGQVVVKAQTTVAGTVAEQTTYLYTADGFVDNTKLNVTYTGTVSSFNKDGDQVSSTSSKTDGNFFILSAGTVGEILVDNTNTTKVSYVVEGNTANEAAFEKALEIGSTVTVTTDNAGNIKVTLK